MYKTKNCCTHCVLPLAPEYDWRELNPMSYNQAAALRQGDKVVSLNHTASNSNQAGLKQGCVYHIKEVKSYSPNYMTLDFMEYLHASMGHWNFALIPTKKKGKYTYVFDPQNGPENI